MPPLIYRVPFYPFRKAATARIKDPLNGLFGTGDLVGTASTPPSQQLRAIYDARTASAPSLPYSVWGTKTGTPDGDQSTTFGAAGAALNLTKHVFSGWMTSTTECDEICDRIVQLFHHQPLVMAGFTTLLVDCQVIDIVPDPVGQHGIIEFRPLIQVTPT